MSKALATYSVTGRLELLVSINIKAENLSAALSDAAKLYEHDFVKILGEYFDGKLTIIGVSDDGGYKLER